MNDSTCPVDRARLPVSAQRATVKSYVLTPSGVSVRFEISSP